MVILTQTRAYSIIAHVTELYQSVYMITGVQTSAFILFLCWYSVMETDPGDFCPGPMLAVGAVP